MNSLRVIGIMLSIVALAALVLTVVNLCIDLFSSIVV